MLQQKRRWAYKYSYILNYLNFQTSDPELPVVDQRKKLSRRKHNDHEIIKVLMNYLIKNTGIFFIPTVKSLVMLFKHVPNSTA